MDMAEFGQKVQYRKVDDECPAANQEVAEKLRPQAIGFYGEESS